MNTSILSGSSGMVPYLIEKAVNRDERKEYIILWVSRITLFTPIRKINHGGRWTWDVFITSAELLFAIERLVRSVYVGFFWKSLTIMLMGNQFFCTMIQLLIGVLAIGFLSIFFLSG